MSLSYPTYSLEGGGPWKGGGGRHTHTHAHSHTKERGGKEGKGGVDKKDAFLPPSLPPSSVSDKIAFLLRSSSRANIFLPVRITLSEEDRGWGGGRKDMV